MKWTCFTFVTRCRHIRTPLFAPRKGAVGICCKGVGICPWGFVGITPPSFGWHAIVFFGPSRWKQCFFLESCEFRVGNPCKCLGISGCFKAVPEDAWDRMAVAYEPVAWQRCVYFGPCTYCILYSVYIYMYIYTYVQLSPWPGNYLRCYHMRIIV